MRAPGIRQRRWHGERPPAPPTAIRTQRDLKQEEELTPNAGRTKNKIFYSCVKSNKNNNSITNVYHDRPDHFGKN